MKKIVVLIAALALVSAFASSALALDGFSPSKGVTVTIDSHQLNASATGPDIYTMGSKNAQGDTAYYTGSSTTRVYFSKVGVSGSMAIPAASGAASPTDSSIFSSAGNAM